MLGRNLHLLRKALLTRNLLDLKSVVQLNLGILVAERVVELATQSLIHRESDLPSLIAEGVHLDDLDVFGLIVDHVAILAEVLKEFIVFYFAIDLWMVVREELELGIADINSYTECHVGDSVWKGDWVEAREKEQRPEQNH